MVARMKDDPLKIPVYQVVGEDCATLEDGRRLYKNFIPELQAGREVELDFSGVQVVTASFFNASLGFLLRDFEPHELSRLVKVSHLEPWAQGVLKRVIKNCRRYYRGNLVEPVPAGNPMLQGVNLGNPNP
jgi:hypothetical protein